MIDELFRDFEAAFTGPTALLPHSFSCQLLEVSEAWCYKWIKNSTTVRGVRRSLLDEAVRRAFVDSKGSYGSPRI